MSSPREIVAIAAASAVVLHQAIWRHRDATFGPTTALLLAGEVALAASVRQLSLGLACQTVLFANLAFTAALTASIFSYRLFYHPLGRFPGPVAAKSTLGYRFVLYALDKQGIKLAEWHRQHGDYVRYGPNHLSITDPALIDAVHRLDKSDHYFTPGLPEVLVNVRSTEKHRPRHQLWSAAFTPAALSSYAYFVGKVRPTCTRRLIR